MSGKKRRNNKLKELYKNPLPIEFIDEKKGNNFELIKSVNDVTNVSLFNFLNIFIKSIKQMISYKLRNLFNKNLDKKDKVITLHFENVIDNEYLISVIGDDSSQRDYLWFNGFFGKGTLSRSQPTWYQRQLSKLDTKTKGNNVALEDMTRIRRQQRMIFKEKRELYEKKVEEMKQNNILNPYEKLIDDYLELRDLKEQMAKQKGIAIHKKNTLPKIELDKENFSDDEIDEEYEILTDQEDFILTIEEYLYLKLIVSKATQSLWNSKYNLILNKKYIVKDGLKFGVDFIVYDKKGPVFQHAEYGVLIRKIDMNQEMKTEDILSRLRVLNTSMKKMILVDIESTMKDEDWMIVKKEWSLLETNDECEKMFINLVQKCKIEQVLVKRWSTDRNRE
ncbi:hypothetical protein ACO0SA_004246 [Hanseniaspora valbyensis]